MLDSIRSNAQSFWVKAAFGVIILVFVFWGVGSFTDMDTSKVVATVNGEPILIQHFERAYRDAEEQALSQNRGMSREDLRAQQLGRHVLHGLVQQMFLRQEARRVGLAVSPLELRQAVGEIKAFQDGQGRFDPEAYARVLASQHRSPAQFEQEMAEEMLRDKLFALVAAPAWADPAEARRRYDFFGEKRTVEYIFTPARQFAGHVRIEDKEVNEYYEANKDTFAIPAKAEAEFIRVSPTALVKPETVSEADARAWYEANKGHFEEKEQVHARHILVPLGEDADEAAVKKANEKIAEIQAKLKEGKDFAGVADMYNEPNAAGKGGDLGWIERGRTVKPFEDAAFALDAGAVSPPVRSQFGLHLINVLEKRAGGVKPYAAVTQQAAEGFASETGLERMADAVDSLIEENILGKPFKEMAERMGLKAEKSGLLSKEEFMARLHLTDAGAQALFAAGVAPVDAALESGDSYIIARVSRIEPAGVKTLENVRPEIVERLTARKALAEAMKSAAKKRGELLDGPLSPQQRKALDVKTAPPVSRVGALADFFPNESLSRAVFETKPHVWLPQPYAVEGKEGEGALLLMVDAVQAPDAKEWESMRAIMENGFTRERRNGMLGMFIQKLASGSEIKIINTAIVDQAGM